MARILVVDDDGPSRLSTREMLEIGGHEVLEAPDGKSGLKIYRREPVDLVLAGIMMVENDGLELIWDLNHDYTGARVIAVSDEGTELKGKYQKNAMTLAASFGALRVLKKPLDRIELLYAVKEALEDSA